MSLYHYTDWDLAEEDDPTFTPVELAYQPFSRVTLFQPNEVIKSGRKVRMGEILALKAVKKQLPNVPIPTVTGQGFRYDASHRPYSGQIYMTYTPGITLQAAWSGLDDAVRLRLCNDIWDLVRYIRTMPRPPDLPPSTYQTFDGTPSVDPLLGENMDPAAARYNDEQLRERIWERYVHYNGLSYQDGHAVKDMLPRSSESVFTHGDLTPRNIILDKDNQLVGILDWEYSGWYPDYWEFASMMAYCPTEEEDWQRWMQSTKPEVWNIEGIQKARRVLF